MKIYKKKLLLTLLGSISLIVMGCSKEINIPIGDIDNSIIKKIDLEKMDKGDQKSLRRFYGVNPTDLEDFSLYVPKSNMDVEEMLILKVKDIEQLDSIEETIEARVNKQIDNFSGYGVEQVGLLDNHEIVKKDKYIFFVVSDKSEEIKDQFLKIIENK